MDEPSLQTRGRLGQFIYVLRLVPRLYEPSAWTPEDGGAVNRHFARLSAAANEGKVILAGRTDEPNDRTFGIVVFEAADEAAALEFMNADPAVAAGVMTAELHPYTVAIRGHT